MMERIFRAAKKGARRKIERVFFGGGLVWNKKSMAGGARMPPSLRRGKPQAGGEWIASFCSIGVKGRQFVERGRRDG